MADSVVQPNSSQPVGAAVPPAPPSAASAGFVSAVPNAPQAGGIVPPPLPEPPASQGVAPRSTETTPGEATPALDAPSGAAEPEPDVVESQDQGREDQDQTGAGAAEDPSDPEVTDEASASDGEQALETEEPEDQLQPDGAAPPEVGADSGLSDGELEELRANEVAFRWQASEYVHHHKGVSWYLVLVGGLALLIAAAAFLHYWLVIGAFLAMGAATIVYARKPPRVLTYELTPKGITIEGRKYLFEEFRSFGVLPDLDWHTIDLEPTKRFRPRIAILFDPKDLDEITSHLELHLPRSDRRPDLIEQATQYLRF